MTDRRPAEEGEVESRRRSRAVLDIVGEGKLGWVWVLGWEKWKMEEKKRRILMEKY